MSFFFYLNLTSNKKFVYCKEFDPKIHLDDQYFSDFRQSAGLSSSVEQNQIIDNLKLTGSDGAFKNGGVLFFAAKPEHFFEKAVIRCVAFEGTTKTQIIDDKIFGGFQLFFHDLPGRKPGKKLGKKLGGKPRRKPGKQLFG